MKTRAILSLVIALLTGFLIGYITANQVRHIKTRDVRSMSSKHGFKERTFDLIVPTDEQVTELTPIVEKYAARFDSLKKSTSGQFKEFLDEFHSEIFPYLDEEQQKKMEEFARHFRKRPSKKEGDKKE